MEIYFTNKRPEEIINKKLIFNFFNLHDIWWLANSKGYFEHSSKKANINFPDGRILSLKLNVKQEKGPYFTKRFLKSKEARDKKHFFIGLNEEEAEKISKITGISNKNLNTYNPPFIKGTEFSEEEREKIIKKLKKFGPDLVWVCIGCPKQTILANQLYESYKTNYFNVGAATDFLLKKKKESPRIFTFLGIEWFYRLVTDFKYSKKKVWRSFLGLLYLKTKKVSIEVR